MPCSSIKSSSQRGRNSRSRHSADICRAGAAPARRRFRDAAQRISCGDEFNSVAEAWTEVFDARIRHDYDLFNDVSTIAGGIYFYHALQDRPDERGETPDAERGRLRNLNTGETWDGAIFAENRFKFGRLSIVPGMRLEFLNQSVVEN